MNATAMENEPLGTGRPERDDSAPSSCESPCRPDSESKEPALPSKGRAFLRNLVAKKRNRCQRALAHVASVLPGGPIGNLCGLAECMPLTAENLLLFTAQGLFPLEWRGKLRWRSPEMRCILPLDRFRVSPRIARLVRKKMFEIRFDTDFDGVLTGCAAREPTWIGPRLRKTYRQAFEMGACHTVEAWHEGQLVGGGFGLTVGTVFTGSSMFTRMNHASKIAFVVLTEHLIACGFTCMDCQNTASHLTQFGAIEIPRDAYRALLARALIRPAHFLPHGATPGQEAALCTPASSATGRPPDDELPACV